MLRYTETFKKKTHSIEAVVDIEYDPSHRLKQRCIGSGSSGSPVGSKLLPPAVTSAAPPSRKTAVSPSVWAQRLLPLLSLFTTSCPGCDRVHRTPTGRRRAKYSATGKRTCWIRWKPLSHEWQCHAKTNIFVTILSNKEQLRTFRIKADRVGTI